MKARARIPVRRTPGKMTKTEERFQDEILSKRLEAGEILRFDFEPVTFRLTVGRNGKPGVSYTPDFLVIGIDGLLEFWDVKHQGFSFHGKGTAGDKSRDKLKLCAEKWPEFLWFRAAPKRKRDGGGWTQQRFHEENENDE